MPKLIFTDTTPAELNAIADELQKAAGDLRAAALAMAEVGFDSLPIPHFLLIEKAVDASNSFAASAKTAIFQARRTRGDFGKPKSDQAAKKRTRTKK